MKAEKESFKMDNAEIVKMHLSTGSSEACIIVYNMMKAIPRTYHGVAMISDKTITAWVTVKKKEITPITEGTVRNKTKRSGVVMDKRILTSQWGFYYHFRPCSWTRDLGIRLLP